MAYPAHVVIAAQLIGAAILVTGIVLKDLVNQTKAPPKWRK